MRLVNNTLCAVLLAGGLLSGCGQSPSRDESGNSPRIKFTARVGPLTADEVQAFVAVAEPVRESLMLAPSRPIAADDLRSLPPRDAAAGLRGRIRETLTAAALAESWSTQFKLQDHFQKTQIASEDFAATALRISLACSAASLAQQIDLQHEARAADLRVNELVAQLESHLRAAARRGQDVEFLRAKDQAWQELEEAVSLSEFLRRLVAVPEDDRLVVAAQHLVLRPFLPQGTDVAGYQRTEVTAPTVLPTRHIELQPRPAANGAHTATEQ